MNLSLQQQVEAELQTYARFGVDLGLDRVETLLAAMDNPHKQVPIVHVAGTNGKGSVCAYLASVLSAAGYKTGRYTSPHLMNWTERICIDGVPISWESLASELQEAKNAIAPDASIPTQFEVFTAAAWQYFAAQKVDVAVIEVGLGGRLDATNVCDQPLATVIVSIGRDHWQRLGDTLGKIASEKAGILKEGVTAIVGPLPAEAKEAVVARASEVGAPIVWVNPAREVGGELIYDDIQYPQTLLGEHQKVNSACAIATIQTLRSQGWQISNEAITEGMRRVRWPGRLQRVQWQGHDILIDGAHNQASARSLRTYLDSAYPNQPTTWLLGMLQTKDHHGVFSELLRAGDQLHLVPVPGHLSAQPIDLSAIARQVCPNLSAIATHKNLAAALHATQQAIQPNQLPTVLCGSLYLIGHFFEQMQTD